MRTSKTTLHCKREKCTAEFIPNRCHSMNWVLNSMGGDLYFARLIL